MKDSIYWHDYEAFGKNPRRDRASQFAGLRTDSELNEIGEPLVIYCRPTRDTIPQPMACLITGITPQLAQQRGLPEAEFVRRIHAEFSRPHSCVAGYNSIRFDDELTRQLLYRNFYDPYEREWRNGNSRWDIIDMLRLCHAVRPEGLAWPENAEGWTSFRLEDLTAANGINHADAHDALSDVRATIALARQVRQHQRGLYDYAFALRSKQKVQAMIDTRMHKPILHVSSMYPASLGCIALAMPLAPHPLEPNGVLLYDLRVDPRPWLEMDVEAIRLALFTPREELAEGAARLPVKILHTNRCPVVVAPGVLDDRRAGLFSIDIDEARRHWHLLQQAPAFIDRLCRAYSIRPDLPVSDDPDYMIYAGFFSDADKRRMNAIRTLNPVQLTQGFRTLCEEFNDSRLPEMLFRYRARNFPESLSKKEQVRWQALCRSRWLPANDVNNTDKNAVSGIDQVISEIDILSAQTTDARAQTVLAELKAWVMETREWLGIA
jgi:exodeoxyribonuclease I